MSIVQLRQVTFYGHINDKQQTVSDLQTIGCLHLIPLNTQILANPERTNTEGTDPISSHSRDALTFLLSSPQMRHQVKTTHPGSANFDVVTMEEKILNVRKNLQDLQDERDFLQRRIKNLQPWGNFDFEVLESFNHLRLWFYLIPHRELQHIPPQTIWQSVKHDHRFHYVVVVSSQEPADMPVKRVHTGAKRLQDLQTRLDEVELAIEDFEVQRFALTRWTLLFINNLHQLEDRNALQQAEQMTADVDPVFALQAWAPLDNIKQLENYATTHGLVLDIKEPHPDDQPPTLFDNPPLLAGGQDLVTFYMTPAYNTWDPSVVVLASFALFFGMILSDAGYALLLGVMLIIVWPKMATSAVNRRLRNVFVALVVSTFIYGAISGSYFGIVLPENSWLMHFKLLDLTDASSMMLLTIGIGVFHIVLGNLMNAWRYGLDLRALAPLGWVCLIAGGFIAGLAIQHELNLLRTFALFIMATGVLLVLFFSGVGASPLQRLAQGLLAMTRITSAFGDVMSYMRLFALGLATASLAVAFNDMAMQIKASESGLALLMAVLILVIGHALNFILGLMSAVVHGLRLNVIEFFNWSLTEEGQRYKAFKRRQLQPDESATPAQTH